MLVEHPNQIVVVDDEHLRTDLYAVTGAVAVAGVNADPHADTIPMGVSLCNHRPDCPTVLIRWAAAIRVAHPTREGTVLKPGDKAPATTGTAYDGATFDLGAPGKRTVLFFYPKANTPG